jgi:hypothetical protein
MRMKLKQEKYIYRIFNGNVQKGGRIECMHPKK